MPTEQTCVVVGAGPGNGLAIGRKFSQHGYAVALLSRSKANLEELKSALPAARTYTCDVTRADSVHTAFRDVSRDLGQVNTLVYNAGSGVFGSIDDLDADEFEQVWRVNTLGCVHCVKTVLPDMRAAGAGRIIIIGATAARRGGARFAAFASAKAAQYNLAQSLARHLGPENIHVTYIVIDGTIDIPRTRARWPEKPADFFLDPNHIANSVFHVAQQVRSAWTFELDLRPYGETW